MKLIKNLFKIIAVLIILFLVAAIAIPYFMKDEIVAIIKEETNKTLNAKVDFKDVELSLLRNFPSITLSIDDLTVDGMNEFENIRLFQAPGAELELDFWKVWGNKTSIPVQAFTLESPKVNILVLKNGKANWDITKPSPTPTNAEPTNFLVEMEAYSIKNGHLTYEDQSLNFSMEMEQLNHTGSGDFSAEVFDLNTKTSIEKINAKMDGISYLKKAKADLDAIINMNINDLVFTLKDNVLNVNDLTLKAEGMVDMEDTAYEMDLKFSSPQNSFKNLWSIIPAAYTADYAQAKIDGAMAISGMIKGRYDGEKEQYPSFKISTQIDNGNVQYPDLPMGLKAIFADVTINSPSSDFNDMVVRIPQFEFKLGNNPIAGNFNLRKPISDPTLKTELRGTLNLADFQKAIPMEGINDLKGIIESDLYINASMSQIDQAKYESIDMRGNLAVADILVKQEGLPTVAITSLKTDFSPQRIRVDNFVAQLGQSDIRASGRIFNLLAYFSPQKTMEGSFEFESNYFNADEWMPEETSTEEQKLGLRQESANDMPRAVLISNTTTSTAVFDRFSFNMDGTIKKMDYAEYELKNMNFKGTINPQRTQIDNFSTQIGESDIQAKGNINNLFGYALNNETLTGDIDLRSNYLDLNQFMTETEATETAENTAPLEVIPVPDNIDLTINSALKKVRYTNFDLNNIKGKVLVKESAAKMQNVQGKILGGAVTFNGEYNTKDLNKPTFNMETALNSLNFKKAFSTFNTFESLAPVGKFIDGKFNTKLSMNGVLGNDMIPDLNTLNLSGFFHTLEGVITGFKPLQQLSDKLNLDSKVKNLKIKDSKNWIKVENGFVEVKEFEHKIDDMSFIIKGRHSLTQQMAYSINAKIPRKLLEKNALTSAANKGWNFLSNEASKIGLNIGNGEFVRLKIDLTGSMTNPKFKILPVAADGTTSAQDAAKNAANEVVNEVVDSVNTIVDETKEQLKEEAKAIEDSLTTVVNEEVDKLKEGAKETGKAVLDSLLTGGDTKNSGWDSLGTNILKDTSLNKEINKAKDKLKDVFRFGKKKKKKEEGN